MSLIYCNVRNPDDIKFCIFIKCFRRLWKCYILLERIWQRLDISWIFLRIHSTPNCWRILSGKMWDQNCTGRNNYVLCHFNIIYTRSIKRQYVVSFCHSSISRISSWGYIPLPTTNDYEVGRQESTNKIILKGSEFLL